MGLSPAEIHALVRERFPGEVVEVNSEASEPHLVVKPAHLVEIAFFCRDDTQLRFDLLSLIAGIDYPDRQTIEVVYCLDSTAQRHRLVIKVAVPRDDPRVPTVEHVWRTADWHERETFDLVGVRFDGHHNLVRILCAEDWVGHPLRKDYVIPDSYHGIKNVVY